MKTILLDICGDASGLSCQNLPRFSQAVIHHFVTSIYTSAPSGVVIKSDFLCCIFTLHTAWTARVKASVHAGDEEELPLQWQSHCHVRMFSYPVSLNSNFGYERYYTSGPIDLAILLSALLILEREAGKEEKNNKKHVFSFLQLINTSFSSLKSYFLTKALFAMDVMFYSNSLRIRHE